MGRYIILKADTYDTTYLLINVYAPNKDKDLTEFFKNLLNKLKKEILDPEENIVMGDDFNCPLNPAIDKKGGTLNERKSVISRIRNCLQNELDLVGSEGTLYPFFCVHANELEHVLLFPLFILRRRILDFPELRA